MRLAARLQAAIEILDQVLDDQAHEGPAADVRLARALGARRYAGARDRAAIRDLVFQAIRAFGEPPRSGRAAMLGLAHGPRPDLLALFDGSPHGPAPPGGAEPVAAPRAAPAWLEPHLAGSLGPGWQDEVAALLQRAPVDLRVNRLKGVPPAQVAAQLPVPAAPVQGLPLDLPDSLRLAAAVPLERHEVWRSGLVEVQDAASQFVQRVCAARPGETVVDLCAGAGGKTLALAADMEGRGRIIACDTDARRLSAMRPRLARAGAEATVEALLLDPGREAERLADLAAAADLVLVDAPCSGSGTWRRNPELRWRLTPARLARLVAEQARLLALGAGLVRPGGRLVFAVCSVLEAEGMAHMGPLLSQGRFMGRAAGPGETWRLTTLRHGCDGFFVASVVLG